MKRTETEILADFVCSTNFDSLPRQVVAKAKVEILDLLGAIFGGYQTECGKMISQYVADQGGSKNAIVVGSGYRVPSASAALANGTMAFILGVDSGEHSSLSHITAPTLPAVLAIGEERDITGSELITAFVLGYDVAVRIGRSIQPSHRLRGFWSISTFPTFGGAAGSAKALALSWEATVNAIGLAGLQASGLGEIESAGTMGRQFMVGKSAQCGVVSALLAERGFTAPRTILSGEKGFCKAFADVYDPSRLTEGLGDQYLIMGGYNKPYPSCRYSHVILDALFNIMGEDPLTLSKVDRIKVYTNAITWDVCHSYEPLNFWGQPSPILSLPLTLALAVSNGSFDHWDQERFPQQLEDPDIRDLANRVELVIDPELNKQPLDKRGCRLEIETRDGKTLVKYNEMAKGDPTDPLTLDEVGEIFKYYASPILGDERSGEVTRIVSEMEELEEITQLTNLLGQRMR
jgi:2-methylcitrate dehydratase PrpD